MANFLSNLWESVFTPGTTPTLLLAANFAFGALQLVLGALLAATYSIHFVILSFLCAALWYAINWFASELQAVEAKELEAERLRRKKRDEGATANVGEAEDNADDEGEDTEVEGGMKESTASLSSMTYDTMQIDEEVPAQVFDAMKASTKAALGTRATGSQDPASAGNTRQRKFEEGYRSGDMSTDSEWEKVDEEQ